MGTTARSFCHAMFLIKTHVNKSKLGLEGAIIIELTAIHPSLRIKLMTIFRATTSN